MQKRSKLQAIIDCKCPRCRQGDLFVYPLAKFSKFYHTHTHCPKCNVRFEQEPGFFFGAMYISYAFIVGILLVTGAIIYSIFDDPHILVYIITVPVIVLLALPFIFRYSRIIYLYLIGGISYNEKYADN